MYSNYGFESSLRSAHDIPVKQIVSLQMSNSDISIVPFDCLHCEAFCAGIETCTPTYCTVTSITFLSIYSIVTALLVARVIQFYRHRPRPILTLKKSIFIFAGAACLLRSLKYVITQSLT